MQRVNPPDSRRDVACGSSAPHSEVSASAVISALSYALDLTEGQPMGHAMQTCLLGMRLAHALHLPQEQQANLYYALLLKDAGCSSNSSKLYHILQSDEIRAKGNLKDKDWTQTNLDSVRYAVDHVAVGQPFLQRVRRLISVAATQQADSCDLVKLRCERGASIARQIGFPMDVALAIASLDEHWNGSGYPLGAKGEEIPLLSRIMNLAQTMAVFWTIDGPPGALDVMQKRSGKWFDPELVRAASLLGADGSLWEGLGDNDIHDRLAELEPGDVRLHFDSERMDALCLAFSEIIDTKSPFTARHSQGVAVTAVAIGERLGMADEEIVDLRRGGLLHDLGKLSVPNSILEKPGKPNEAEWVVLKKHPYYTLEILKRVPGFEELSEVAAAHHERLDGTGYFRGWDAKKLNLQARILAVADVYDALAAARPYREALPLEKVFSIMSQDAGHALDAECLEALQQDPVALPRVPVRSAAEKEPEMLPFHLVPIHAF